MWSKIAGLYRAIEEEQCMVLADPGTLDAIAPGYRRFMAAKLAAMGPLERARLLAFSVKYRGKRLRTTLAQIALVSTLCGLVAYALFPQQGLIKLLIMSNAIGVWLVILILSIRFSHTMIKPLHYVLFMTASLAGGMIAGAASGGWERGFTFLQSIEKQGVQIVAACCAAGLIIAIPVTLMGVIRNRQYKQYTAKLELDAERHLAARELSESRLRLLHAQIEPHFLYNTLGAVQQLAEKGAPDAARLTASLITFLRASQAEMRSEHVSLGADFALLEAYLQVMKARLGTRLDYRLDLPDSLFGITIPSMMLLTLVENAIKHGIEPSLQGGSISVAAVVDETGLRMTVCDTGPGLGSAPGNGDGVANVRARLRLLYGDTAALTLIDGDESGVAATIVLPLDRETR